MTTFEHSRDDTRSPDVNDRNAGTRIAPAAASMAHVPTGVLCVGPPLHKIGGMVSVIRQTLSLTYDGRYRIEHMATSHAPDGGDAPLGKLIRHVRQLRELRQAVRRSQARVVHLHTCSGFSFYRSVLDLAVTRRLGCRTILHVHGGGFRDFFDGSNRLGRIIIARALRQADVVVALSASWRAAIGVMSPTARVVVIENAVAIPESTPRECAARRDDRCHFIMLGPMDRSKGVADALTAATTLAARQTPFRLTLAGPPGDVGDERSIPRKLESQGLHECVRYVGPVTGADKTALLNSGDVFLQPSHVEGMPMSILEAIAHGIPVVGSMVGAIPEVIEHGLHGLLVPPREPAALVNAMTRMVRWPSARDEMGINARRLAADRFSSDRLDRDLTELYDALLGAKRSADLSTVTLPTAPDQRPKRSRA